MIWLALFYFILFSIGDRRAYWDFAFASKLYEGLMLTLELTLELSISKIVVTVPFSNSPSFSIFPCVLWSGIHSVQHGGGYGGGSIERWQFRNEYAILFFNVPCKCPTLALESTCTSEFLPGRVMGFGYNSILGWLCIYDSPPINIWYLENSLPYILLK